MADDNNKPKDTNGSLDEVGYCSPPINTRFQKGVSGNPKGRPKGSANVATIFAKTLREKVVVNEHGRRRTVTKLEAALKQLVNKAASGDLRALRQLLELSREVELKQGLQADKNLALGEIDQEIIEGILKRFSVPTETSLGTKEGGHGNDHQS